MRETSQGYNSPLRWAISKAMFLLIIGVLAAMMINWSDDDLIGKERVSAVGAPPNTRLPEERIDTGQRTLTLQADQRGAAATPLTAWPAPRPSSFVS
jgi:hypothetical protein